MIGSLLGREEEGKIRREEELYNYLSRHDRFPTGKRRGREDEKRRRRPRRRR